MKRWAELDSSTPQKVLHIVVSEDDWTPDVQYIELKNKNKEVQQGWTYDGSKFIPPPVIQKNTIELAFIDTSNNKIKSIINHDGTPYDVAKDERIANITGLGLSVDDEWDPVNMRWIKK